MPSFFELLAKREPVECPIDPPKDESAAEYNARHTLKVETDEGGIVAAGRFPQGGEL